MSESSRSMISDTLKAKIILLTSNMSQSNGSLTLRMRNEL